MKIFEGIKDVKEYLKREKNKNKSIGFVPTMGYLHDGHMSLINKSIEENDITVVSIFVNPVQFGPTEDFEKYPRDKNRDIGLCRNAGVDVLFIPAVEEMYPKGYNTYVEVKRITDKLCGASRPGHFTGVATVVTKLFNIVEPDRAYFGQKDAQQAVVIIRMVNDLNMDVQVVVCPIVREESGLAMSSRNVYLNKEERTQALVLYQSLVNARNNVERGERIH